MHLNIISYITPILTQVWLILVSFSLFISPLFTERIFHILFFNFVLFIHDQSCVGFWQ